MKWLSKFFFAFFSTLRLAIHVLISSSKSKGHTKDNYNSSSLICQSFNVFFHFTYCLIENETVKILAVNLFPISACILVFLQKQNNLLSAGFHFFLWIPCLNKAKYYIRTWSEACLLKWVGVLWRSGPQGYLPITELSQWEKNSSKPIWQSLWH